MASYTFSTTQDLLQTLSKPRLPVPIHPFKHKTFYYRNLRLSCAMFYNLRAIISDRSFALLGRRRFSVQCSSGSVGPRDLLCFYTVVGMAPDMSGEQHSNVKYEEEFIQSSRGVKLFTCRWLPADREAKALICLCHGYGIECSIFMEDTGLRLAKAGYAVFGIDYEGHGKSAGTRCYIKCFDDLVTDCATFFRSVAECVEYRKKPRFLYGESMGGAVALLIHRKQPNYWSGAVLVAPMCKITEELKPHPLVLSILWTLTAIIPTWKIMPTQDILDVGFKDPDKRTEIRANPYFYRGRPRLKTAFELLMTSLDIEKRLDEVRLPFLIVHGKDDKVTDPSVSKLLYASAKSCDKTLKLYPNMWHGLTYGEPPEHIELVFSDIIAWLGKRSASQTSLHG